MIEVAVDANEHAAEERMVLSIGLQSVEELKVIYGAFSDAFFSLDPTKQAATRLLDKILIRIETYAKEREINL